MDERLELQINDVTTRRDIQEGLQIYTMNCYVWKLFLSFRKNAPLYSHILEYMIPTVYTAIRIYKFNCISDVKAVSAEILFKLEIINNYLSLMQTNRFCVTPMK